MSFLHIFSHVKESESKLCYSLPAVLNTCPILRYLYFAEPFTWQILQPMRKPSFLSALPAPCSAVWGWAELSPAASSQAWARASPAQRSSSSSSWCLAFSSAITDSLMVCFLFRLSFADIQAEFSHSGLSQFMSHQAGIYLSISLGDTSTGLCVRNKHSYTESCSFSGKAVLSPRENAPAGFLWVHNSTKGSGLTWIDLKYIFSSLSGRRNIEDVP